MKFEVEANCPMNGFNPCKQMKCAWFIQVRGMNPNTGKEVDEWGCAISWIPTLMIDNSNLQRQTGAAVESFRNEMVRANETNQQVLLAAANTPRLIGEN
jgi:hypothetical protein